MVPVIRWTLSVCALLFLRCLLLMLQMGYFSAALMMGMTYLIAMRPCCNTATPLITTSIVKGIEAMTTRNCIAPTPKAEAFPATLRRYTVAYICRHPTYERIPAITLKGRWLAQAGFTPGQKMEVRVMDGCIVITASRPNPVLEQATQRMAQLPERSQKQVMAMIARAEKAQAAMD